MQPVAETIYVSLVAALFLSISIFRGAAEAIARRAWEIVRGNGWAAFEAARVIDGLLWQGAK